MVAQDDHLAPLVASTIAINSSSFFMVNKKGEVWLHEPAVYPKVDDYLDPAIETYEVGIIHRSSAMKCN